MMLLHRKTGTSGSTRGDPADESHLHQRRKHLHHRIHQDEPERAGTLGPGNDHIQRLPLTKMLKTCVQCGLSFIIFALHRRTSRSLLHCWSWTQVTECCYHITTQTQTWSTSVERCRHSHSPIKSRWICLLDHI